MIKKLLLVFLSCASYATVIHDHSHGKLSRLHPILILSSHRPCGPRGPDKVESRNTGGKVSSQARTGPQWGMGIPGDSHTISEEIQVIQVELEWFLGTLISRRQLKHVGENRVWRIQPECCSPFSSHQAPLATLKNYHQNLCVRSKESWGLQFDSI